jgi:2-polyprenyl-6-methoxyphenol hydroxylase-like FAD-dependent oxidoreductase
MKNARILVSGGGIAGLTLAYWLDRHGFSPTVIDCARGPACGGCLIDFCGIGYEIADRMQLLNTLRAEQIDIRSLDYVDAQGRLLAALDVRKFRELLEWRHFNLLRSALERSLRQALQDRVEVKFATSVTALEQDPHGVDVSFQDGTAGRYDLVVGAEGLRSGIRRLVFGPDSDFERFLGYYGASATIASDRSVVFSTHAVPGREVSLYSLGDGRAATFFLFGADKRLAPTTIDERKTKLRETFADVGWKTPALLDALCRARDFYFEAVSQIQMPSWSRGRVVLVGDACQSVSLIAGQGAALAMAGAYVLAGELRKSGGNHLTAFTAYQSFMGPHVDRIQELARRIASSYVPSTDARIANRDAFVKMMFMPLVSRWFMDRFFYEEMALPPYR